MPDIVLYEYKPTRSSKCRWALNEAGLEYRSEGNSIETFHSDAVRKIHPMGKLPAALIDGKPLFESSAIVAAICDLVPEKNLIAKPGTWARTLHDQWTLFATSEVEAWGYAGFKNKTDSLLPEEERKADVVEQSAKFYRAGAQVLEDRLAKTDFMLEDRFTATDINVCIAVGMGWRIGFLSGGFPNLKAYLKRLMGREACPIGK